MCPSRIVFETQLLRQTGERVLGSQAGGDELHDVDRTNDVGVNGPLPGNQAPGVTVMDVIACAVNCI